MLGNAEKVHIVPTKPSPRQKHCNKGAVELVKSTSCTLHTSSKEKDILISPDDNLLAVGFKHEWNHKKSEVFLRGEFSNIRDFSKLIEMLKSEVVLPTDAWHWQLDLKNNILVCFVIDITASGVNVKSLQISSDGKVLASYNGAPILRVFPNEILNPLEVSGVLNAMHLSYTCRGFPTPKLLISSVKESCHMQMSKSPFCEILIRTGSRCIRCKIEQKHLKKAERRNKGLETQFNVMRRDLSKAKKQFQVRSSAL